MKKSHFILFLLLPHFLLGNFEQDSLRAKEIADLAYEDAMKGKFQEAVSGFYKSANLYEKLEIWNDYFHAHLLRVRCHTTMGEYEIAERCLDSLEVEIEDRRHQISYEFVKGDWYYKAGILASREGNMEDTQKHFEKALECYQKIYDPVHTKIANMYMALGVNSFHSKDYANAELYYNKALKIYLKISPAGSQGISRLYNNRALVYEALGQMEKASEDNERSLEMKLKVFGASHPSIAISYNNIGNFYKKLKEYDKAQDYYEKSLEIELAVFGENHFRIGEKYGEMAAVFEHQKDFQKAIEYTQKGIDIFKNQLNLDNRKLSRAYDGMANSYISLADFETAFRYHQKALNVFVENLDESSKFSSPKIDDLKEDEYLMWSLEGKAESLVKYFEHTQDEKALKAALENYLLAASVIDLIRNGMKEESSKFFLLEDVRSIYEGAINVCHQLYELNESKEYVEMAFNFAERNKAILLRLSIQTKEAMHFSGIPDEVLEKENLTINTIRILEKSLAEIALTDNQTITDSLENELFKEKRKYQLLIANLEENYPSYHHLKYDLAIKTVANIQSKLLTEDAVLVEYFEGEDVIYILSFTGDNYSFLKVSKPDDFEYSIKELVSNLNDFALAEKRGSDPQFLVDFSKKCFSISKLLFPSSLKFSKEQLIIIPDGILNIIPFEILLTQEPFKDQNYSNLPYLLKKHTIRYSYSSTMLFEENPKANSSNNLAAFAATYEGEPNEYMAVRSGFSSLKHNISEVNLITDLIGGKAIIGSEASERKFKKISPNYKFLHLAMHAFTDDENPMHSGLVFTDIPDSIEDNTLHAFELYNMNFDADLVVLSACNTGSGKLAKGEGAMSLARAFRYAGCQNIVMSLWQADDEATSRIMQDFYKNLKNGVGKADALRTAKLNYLENNPKTFPHYWAAFVLMGDGNPITFQNSYMGYALSGIVLLLTLLITYRKFTKS